MQNYTTDRTIPAIFNQIKPQSTFLSIKSYQNNFNEIADYKLVFHFSYDMALAKAIDTWKSIKPRNNIEKFVLQDLIQSYTTSLLDGFNPRAYSAHAYCSVQDYHAKVIDGVKYHMKNQELHLVGLVLNKKVLRPGIYPNRNTTLEHKIREQYLGMTTLSKYRQFKLIQNRFKIISVENLTLTDLDLLKKC